MATVPPPYSPRDQRRQARDYWRTQRQAARMQQNYSNSLRRSSITGPVVLLLIGIVALMIETGHIQANIFWEWYRQWWPLLLIGIGVISLLEWVIDRNNPHPVRRSLGGLIFFIFIVSCVGWAGSANWVFGPDRLGIFPGDGDSSPFSVFGRDYENDHDSSMDVAAGSAVEIQDPHGDVTVTASPDSELRVHSHEVARTTSQSDADRIFHDLEPKLTVSGTSVLVRVDEGGGRADLTIEVPKSSIIGVTAGHGDVTMEGLDGAANVTARHGDVKLDGMRSNVTAHLGQGRYSNRGDFSAHAIDGDITLDGAVNDLTISEVKGKVLLTGEYFGDTHLERIAKGVHFHSSRTDMELASLSGDVTMDSDDLHIAQVAGPLRIVTGHKDIDASQIAGDIDIENKDGDVNVQPASPLGNIHIDSKNRPITVTMPPGSNFSLSGRANHGDLNTDYNLNVGGSDENHSVSGQVGSGGVRVQLDSDHGDITVRKGDAEVPPIAPLEPVKPPSPSPNGGVVGGGKVRHLKVPAAPPVQPAVQ